MKRFLIIILLSLLVGKVTLAYDFSAVCESGQTLYYNITSNTEPYTVEVTSSYESHPSGDVIVPEIVVNNNITYSVTRIGNSAFFNCELTSVTIPNSITSIGNEAFYSCNGLTSIIIPETVISIGNSAFLDCSGLTGTLTIPNSVTIIGSSTFESCSNLTSIIIPNSVTSIGNYAFQNCTGLVGTLTIPNSTITIGQAAFSNCRNLTSVTIGNSVTSIGNNAFQECTSLTSITIGSSVENIDHFAFRNCNGLTSVYYTGDISKWCEIAFGTSDSNPISFSHNLYIDDNPISELVIPETITEIKNYAFYGASDLTSVSIPHSVSSIGIYAFCGCSSLASITLHGSLSNIGMGAFMNCQGLVGIMDIPNSVESIGESAFENCNELTSVTIGNSVTSIGNSAFYGCSGLTDVNFNATNCTTMGNLSYPVFNGCTSLETLNIGENVTNIPSCAFYGCSTLTSVTIPNHVTNIDGYAFRNCSSLSSVTIGNSVENIGTSAFNGCTNLTSITIPNSVENIGTYAFASCTSLTSITIPNSVTTIGNGVFSRCSGLSGELTIPNSVTSIGNLAFQYCSGLTSVYIPNSVTSIGYDAFKYCSGLTSITIPQSVTNIGNTAFDNCTALTTVNFNATNCTSMGSSSKQVFKNCTSLSVLNIGENVTNIPDNAFKLCSGLSNVSTIPNSVVNIGSYAFYGCSELTGITIPNSVIRIGENAFNNTGWYNNHSSGILYLDTWCIGYKGTAPTGSLVINNEINGVADLAFSNCNGLTSLIIPNSVIGIGKKAFQLCTRLNSVLIPSSVLYIGDSAFYMVPNIAYNGTASGSPWGALSANLYCDDGLFYTSMAKDTLVSALRTIVSADIPNTVVAILPNAFNGCDAITSLTIGPSVKNIGSYAFAGCSSLGYVNIPDSVEVIGEYAFSRCGLTAVNIGASVDSIASYAFDRCQNLNTINYNATNCSYLGGSNTTFTNCSSLTTLNIGNNVTAIPAYAFNNCTRLSGELIIPDSVINIGSYCFYGCSGLSSITIGKSVTNIGTSAFSRCDNLITINLNAVRIDNAGNDAFYRSTNGAILNIGEFVAEIPPISFFSTTADVNIAEISVSSANTTFDSRDYCNAVIKTATNTLVLGCGNTIIPNTVTSIGNASFSRCANITNIDIPNSVTSIGYNAFYLCSVLTYITLPGSVTSIGSYAFSGCNELAAVYYNGDIAQWCGISFGNADANPLYLAHNLYISNVLVTNLVIPENITTIKPFSFCGANLTSVATGNSVTSIDRYAFYGCRGLTSAIIGDSVTSIGYVAFYECRELSELTLGRSVDSIGEGAFNNCIGITDIYAKPTIPPILYYNSFYYLNYDANLWVSCGTMDVYAAGIWGNFHNKQEDRTYMLDVASTNPQYGMVQITQHPDCTDGTAIISATANEHYHFVQWNDGNTDNPRTIMVTEDTTFVAMFANDQHLVSVVSADETMGTVSEGGTYEYGAELLISAIANEHHHFLQWNDGNTDNPRTIVVEGDATYAASFAIDQHTVTLVENNQTMGATWGSGRYYYGSEIEIAAYPRAGYAFLSWNDGNTETPRTIIVESDTTFTAIFATARTVTIESSDNEMGYVIGSGEYAEGAEIEITAVPYEGYRFDHWVDVDNPSRDFNTDNPRTIVVSTDVTYIAVFTDVVGIEDNDTSEILIFPNPASDIVEISANENITRIEVVSAAGQVLHETEVNEESVSINVKNLPSGTYFVRIFSNSNVIVKKLVVM